MLRLAPGARGLSSRSPLLLVFNLVVHPQLRHAWPTCGCSWCRSRRSRSSRSAWRWSSAPRASTCRSGRSWPSRRAAPALPRLRRLAGDRDRARWRASLVGAGQRVARRVRRHPADHRHARRARGRPRARAGVRRRPADRAVRPDPRRARQRRGARRADHVVVLVLVVTVVGRRGRSTGPRSAAGWSRSAATGPRPTLAGLPVRARWSPCTCSAACSPPSPGVLNTARQGASDPSFVGLLIELSAITAVVVGGTPLSGGRVRILGTLAGRPADAAHHRDGHPAQPAGLDRPHDPGGDHRRRRLRPAWTEPGMTTADRP